MKKRTPQRKGTARLSKPGNPVTRGRTYALMIVCVLTLVAGFFFAGRQHFSSMDYGIKNSRLRKQIDALEAEKRRLLLAREISLSPNEIKKAARKSGLTDDSVTEAEVARSTPTVSESKDKPISTPASQ